MMLGIVFLSFTLLSAAFMLLSYRYIIADKRSAVERNAQDLADLVSQYVKSPLSGDVTDEIFTNSLLTISKASDSLVVLADSNGKVIYTCDGENIYLFTSTVLLPQFLIQQVRDQGGYTGMTNLDGLYPENRYVAARPYTIAAKGQVVPVGMVLASADTSSVLEMWRATGTIFFFTAVVVLLIAVIAASLTSALQTRPINEMVDAARKFGQGEFDVRVSTSGDNCDELHNLAVAFNSMANSLAQVEAQRSEFIANVSHELKTPMTTIAGFAEGILDGTIPPERERESLEIIVSETRRLSRLVRRMLDLSRLKALTENVTAQEQFDLTDVLSRVVINLEGKITQRGLDVNAQLPEEPLMVWGDPDAVTQICYNLLDNAAKFAAPETTLTISTVKKDGKVHTTIQNLGATIPPEELPLLFDRFHKTDASRSADRDGVGLGLYIVKSLIGNLKEQITATSEDGVTRFTFTLTLA
jgi:signal transduction histidine kinase